MASAAAGKNQASRTVAGDSPAPASDKVPSGAIRAPNGDGRGTLAAAAANSGASEDGAGALGGSSRVKRPSSGTQMRSHTSQLAAASICSGPLPGVTVSGSKTSPV